MAGYEGFETVRSVGFWQSDVLFPTFGNEDYPSCLVCTQVSCYSVEGLPFCQSVFLEFLFELALVTSAVLSSNEVSDGDTINDRKINEFQETSKNF